LAYLPPEGDRRLFELWKQIPERWIEQSGSCSPLEQLRNVLIRMSEHWPNDRVFDYQKDVPLAWENCAACSAVKFTNQSWDKHLFRLDFSPTILYNIDEPTFQNCKVKI